LEPFRSKDTVMFSFSSRETLRAYQFCPPITAAPGLSCSVWTSSLLALGSEASFLGSHGCLHNFCWLFSSAFYPLRDGCILGVRAGPLSSG
jgi:hypothetical protein